MAANDEPVLWIDGDLVPLSKAFIPVTDHSFLAGDGAFETFGVVDETPVGTTRHLTRLRHSLHGLNLELDTPDTELAEAVTKVVDANPGGCDWVRMTVTGGDAPFSTERHTSEPRIVIAPGITPEEPESVAVVTAPWPRNELGALAGLKTTSYAENAVALAYAKNRQASEVLFANTRGELCEGATTNVFVVLDSELVTPPLTSGCLEGVTRYLVLSSCEVSERPILMNELPYAAEAFLTSSVRGAIPITRIDDRELPIGPRAREAQDKYVALIKENPDP